MLFFAKRKRLPFLLRKKWAEVCHPVAFLLLSRASATSILAVNGMNPDKEPEKKKAKALEELAREEAAEAAMADSKKQEEEERASCGDWD